MKRIAFLLAATAFGTPALAADVFYDPDPTPLAPVASIPVWTGFYVGVQGGAAFNPATPDRLLIDPSFGINTPVPGFTAGATPGFFANTIGAAFGDSFNSPFDSGFTGGVHAGYDWQFDNFVVGALIDVSATDVKVRQNADSNTPAFYNATRDLDVLATGRLRAGYLVTPTALAYATGGVAYGDINYTFETDSPAVSGHARSLATARPATVFEDENEWGYTVGGGLEVLVTENISFGAEYLYTNLGGGDSFTRIDGGPFDGDATNGAGTTGGFTDFRSTGDFDFHTVTAKLSYRFN